MTVDKNLFFDNYKKEIEKGKLNSIRQFNCYASTDFSYNIYFNTLEDLADAFFGGSDTGYTKENLFVPEAIRNLPFESESS